MVAGIEADGARFQDYVDDAEPLATAPSHRALAMLRGRKEEVLTLELVFDPEDERLGTDTSGIARLRIVQGGDDEQQQTG